MGVWRRMHEIHPLLRWPLKLALFIGTTLLVLFPNPALIPVLFERLSNLEKLLDASEPGLAPLEQRVRDQLAAGGDVADLLAIVEAEVYATVPYAHDWQTWGVMEYLPTVSEVLEKGREDCDGRAVVAASLLRRLGQPAWLVSDLLHMWVQTPGGEAMGPTGSEKTLSSGRPGAERTQTVLTPRTLVNVGRGLSYGVAVFPLERQLIILAALCALTVHPWSSGWRRLSGCLLLWIGLDLMRDAGHSAALEPTTGARAAVMLGAMLILTGWLVLAVKATDRRPGSAPGRPG